MLTYNPIRRCHVHSYGYDGPDRRWSVFSPLHRSRMKAKRQRAKERAMRRKKKGASK